MKNKAQDVQVAPQVLDVIEIAQVAGGLEDEGIYCGNGPPTQGGGGSGEGHGGGGTGGWKGESIRPW